MEYLFPVRHTFLKQVKYHEEMHDPQSAEKFYRILKENELILPPTAGKADVLYEIMEYDPLLDSSNMSCKDWIKIAEDIGRNYNKYDGFVILHGTDTMAYTASALSFMFQGLKKPIIITGSQYVYFFANKLLRGNRTAKISSDALDAFASPNYHTLADVGIDVKLNHIYIRKQESTSFAVQSNLNPNAAILTFCPTITNKMLQSFLKPPLEGLVLQSYGAGNLPSHRNDILQTLKDAVTREILIINISQCSRGQVSSFYETGKVLDDIGIISGTDMTPEAALTKLIYILGLPKMTYEKRVKLMKINLRGELSSNELYKT
ncbi:hypothetical protein NQ317_004724 [Molorchus minor]|uniref:asparaginase n=1 Tax=Molorchus minor TaxID=1323400 RepID=A0ABQ9JP80_9CUCU|nr:hypothetical protein NQ317_004724 [Molorchus minor]